MSGTVATPDAIEHHVWKARHPKRSADWLDQSWRQVPPGSFARSSDLLDRADLGDSADTVRRCAVLLQRVLTRLATAE